MGDVIFSMRGLVGLVSFVGWVGGWVRRLDWLIEDRIGSSRFGGV